MVFYKKTFFDLATPVVIYHKLKEAHKNEPTFLFESVVNNENGNFSYIIAGEIERVYRENGKSYHKDESGNTKEIDDNPLDYLRKYYKTKDGAKYQELSKEIGIDFIDGFMGYIGYECGEVFEPKLKKSFKDLKDTLHTPDLVLIRPKLIVAFAHKNSSLTMITPKEEIYNSFSYLEEMLTESFSNIELKKCESVGEGSFAIEKEKFFDLVNKCKEEITKGEVFQILMSNRFTQKAKVDPLSFYRVLRSKNPSPYLFLLELDGFSIAGSSPEVMVRLTNGEILLRPIAGTRKRGKTHARDLELEKELLEDKKEIAEHLMLVDLGRNDVGRVAKSGTVEVEEFMHVERYSHVMHIVSDVVAQIEEDKDMFDLLKATFTAGTMTGAPKVRAMELIAGFEKTKRGFYSGTIALFGFNGNMDSSITIRSSMIKDDEIIFHAGAGVVADSQEELEWLEVNNKIAATLESFKDLT